MCFTKNWKERFCEKYTRIALFFAFGKKLHDKFLTKNRGKSSGVGEIRGGKKKFTIVKKEESYCIYKGNMVA